MKYCMALLVSSYMRCGRCFLKLQLCLWHNVYYLCSINITSNLWKSGVLVSFIVNNTWFCPFFWLENSDICLLRIWTNMYSISKCYPSGILYTIDWGLNTTTQVLTNLFYIEIERYIYLPLLHWYGSLLSYTI